MKVLLQQFARIFLVCWLVVLTLIMLTVVYLVASGGSGDFLRLNTWAALGMTMVFATFWALLPSAFLAALFCAVNFWGGHKQLSVAAKAPPACDRVNRAGPKT
jgi:hypothetical protein